MLLNSLAVFQLLRYARVLTVANFASCDYFSYLSRCEWTNMLKYPLWWCWRFFSEAQQSDALNNEMSGLTRWRTHLSLMAYEKQTFVFLLSGTFFSFLVTFSMVTSARMVFGFVCLVFFLCIPGAVFWGEFEWDSKNKIITATALLFWDLYKKHMGKNHGVTEF